MLGIVLERLDVVIFHAFSHHLSFGFSCQISEWTVKSFYSHNAWCSSANIDVMGTVWVLCGSWILFRVRSLSWSEVWVVTFIQIIWVKIILHTPWFVSVSTWSCLITLSCQHVDYFSNTRWLIISLGVPEEGENRAELLLFQRFLLLFRWNMLKLS